MANRYICSKRNTWWQNSFAPLLQSYQWWMGKGPHAAFAFEECWDQPDSSVPKLKDMENSVSWQKLSLVRMWKTKFLIKEPKSDSTDKLPRAAHLMCRPGDIWLWFTLYYKSQATLLTSKTPILDVCAKITHLSGMPLKVASWEGFAHGHWYG